VVMQEGMSVVHILAEVESQLAFPKWEPTEVRLWADRRLA
jgi:hypothetical protein